MSSIIIAYILMVRVAYLGRIHNKPVSLTQLFGLAVPGHQGVALVALVVFVAFVAFAALVAYD